jgi:hypothetical protein
LPKNSSGVKTHGLHLWMRSSRLQHESRFHCTFQSRRFHVSKPCVPPG